MADSCCDRARLPGYLGTPESPGTSDATTASAYPDTWERLRALEASDATTASAYQDTWERLRTLEAYERSGTLAIRNVVINPFSWEALEAYERQKTLAARNVANPFSWEALEDISHCS